MVSTERRDAQRTDGAHRPFEHPGSDDLPARDRDRDHAIAAALDALIEEARGKLSA
ncbi:hypothetical protein [Micromonospora aurantiaca (nom. illeg.)]|uniref:hypothetical protein n=1 Tax=Micromonospora aurantiaca (nom. illeg.) TaxID=47850 RepID=UPI000ACA55C2|nr:hypothetical protein [Micromonospora aurantiaca]